MKTPPEIVRAGLPWLDNSGQYIAHSGRSVSVLQFEAVVLFLLRLRIEIWLMSPNGPKADILIAWANVRFRG